MSKGTAYPKFVASSNYWDGLTISMRDALASYAADWFKLENLNQ